MWTKLSLFLSLSGAALLGLVIGLYAQSNTGAKLSKLSDEKAEISKMDLILLNSRVAALQQLLKDDLSLPFVPTSFSYDVEKQKIRTSVYIDPAFLAKVGASQLNKALDYRATGLCITPAQAEGNFGYMIPVQPPREYCAIRFFTLALDAGGHAQTREVASFEDGKLILK
jgi:hypothetical protein